MPSATATARAERSGLRARADSVPELPGLTTGSPSAQRGQVAGPGSYVGRSSDHSARSG